MQISSNYSAFNFSSVYKSVTTKHTPPEIEKTKAATDLVEETARKESEQSAVTHREMLQLQAAQRITERTAETMSSTPDL